MATFDKTVPPADARRGHLTWGSKAVRFLSEFTFLSIERVYAVCKLGRWKTSHVRLAGRGMVYRCSVLYSLRLRTPSKIPLSYTPNFVKIRTSPSNDQPTVSDCPSPNQYKNPTLVTINSYMQEASLQAALQCHEELKSNCQSDLAFEPKKDVLEPFPAPAMLPE